MCEFELFDDCAESEEDQQVAEGNSSCYQPDLECCEVLAHHATLRRTGLRPLGCVGMSPSS